MVAYDNTSGCAGIWLLGGNVALANVTVLCGDGELNGITGRVDGLPRSIGPAAAELALSCLPQAQALNPSEVQRALFQCKEQSRDMLEKACLAVESAAKGGGV
jgi:hypothetical protein